MLLGDLFLLQSGVFTIEDYAKELSTQFQRHFSNDGRLNYSVADSSFDTWLDGYVAGVPGRKVSIYTEGCLLAFVLDTMIMRATENKATIHDLMHTLYHKYAKEGLPYTELIYRKEAEALTGLDLSEYFTRFVNGTATYEGVLLEALAYVGMEMVKTDNPVISQRVLGARFDGNKIKAIAPGSPAEMCGLSIEDQVMAVNNFAVNKDVDKWLLYFMHDLTTLQINRKGTVIHKVLPQVDLSFMKQFRVRKLEVLTRTQREAFNKWSSKKNKF